MLLDSNAFAADRSVVAEDLQVFRARCEEGRRQLLGCEDLLRKLRSTRLLHRRLGRTAQSVQGSVTERLQLIHREGEISQLDRRAHPRNSGKGIGFNINQRQSGTPAIFTACCTPNPVGIGLKGPWEIEIENNIDPLEIDTPGNPAFTVLLHRRGRTRRSPIRCN